MASKTKNIKNTNTYKKIKSNYILKEIFDNLSEKKLLKIIKVNKNIQKCLNKGLNDFKMFYEKIEIELELLKEPTYPNCFINYRKKYENYFHIYFDNDMKKEVKKNFVNYSTEKVNKVKIIIDNKIKSLSQLFENCINIKKMNFIKFNRKDIPKGLQSFPFKNISISIFQGRCIITINKIIKFIIMIYLIIKKRT